MVTFVEVFNRLGLDIEIKDGAVPCLFHEEKLPSCFFNHETGMYHCFSGECQRGGNAISYFQEYNKVINNMFYTYKECKIMLEGRSHDIRDGKIHLEFTRNYKLVPKDTSPFYLNFKGLDRIKSIQGYPVSNDTGIKWLLD